MVAGRAVGWLARRVRVRVEPRVAAALAALDVGWGALVRFGPRLLDADLLPTAASLVVGTVLGVGIAPVVAATVLYGYLVYALAPRVFPRTVRHVTDRRGFRLLAAANAVLVPLLLYSPLPDVSRFLLLGGVLLLPAYLLVVQRGRVAGPGGYPIAFANGFDPTSNLQREYHDDPKVAARTPKFWTVLALYGAIAVVFSYLTLLVLGGLLALLYLTYPVPELLVLGWVGYRGLLASRVGPAPPEHAGRRFDLEARVVTLAGVATDGIKGFTSVLLAGIGLVVPVFFLYVVVYNAGNAARIAGAMAAGSGTRLLAAVVGVTTLVVYGLYGVWYWLRLLSRVPHAMRAWRDRLRAEVRTPPDREFGPLLARPPGYFLPAAAMLVALGLLVAAGDWPSDPRIPLPYLAVWLAGLAGTAWSTYRGVRGEPRGAAADWRALPGSYAVHLTGLWLWVDAGDGDSLVVGALTGRVPAADLVAAFADPTTGFFLVVTVTPLYLFYVPDVIDSRRADGLRRFAYVPYLLAVGVAAAVVAVTATGFARLFGGALAVAVLVAVAVSASEDPGGDG